MTPPPAAGVHRERYGPDSQHFGDLYLPGGPGPHPVVILLHGGCWRARYDLGYVGPLAAEIAGCGVAVWSLEYRRIGNAGGGWPGTFEDVARGADHVRTLARRFPLDRDRVVAAGHSAGGHLALWVAARRPGAAGPLGAADPLRLRGVVSLAGIPDLALALARRVCGSSPGDLMGGPPEALPDRYRLASPSAWIPLGLPQRLISGALDDVVPLDVVEPYAAAARRAGDPLTLTVLPGLGHFELTAPDSAAWPAIRAAILELLDLEPPRSR